MGLSGPITVPGIHYNSDTKQWFNGFTGKTFNEAGDEVTAPEDTFTDSTDTINTTGQPGLNTTPDDSGAPSPGNATLPGIQVEGIAAMLGDPVMQKLVANMSVSDFIAMMEAGIPNPNTTKTASSP